MKEECCNIHEIIQDFYTYLYNYTLQRVNNTAIAEDIVQDVMIQLIDAHQKSKAIGNIKAWLFQVTRNTIYDYYKKNNLAYQLEKEENIQVSSSAFSDILTADYVIPMIKLLPDDYAVPLMLSDIDELPQKQIAQQLNLTLSATKMRIQRARKKLKDLFLECCHLEYDKQGNFIGCTIKNSCSSLQQIKKDLECKIEEI